MDYEFETLAEKKQRRIDEKEENRQERLRKKEEREYLGKIAEISKGHRAWCNCDLCHEYHMKTDSRDCGGAGCLIYIPLLIPLIGCIVGFIIVIF